VRDGKYIVQIKTNRKLVKNAHRWKIRKSQKNSFVNKNEIIFGKRGTPSHPPGLFFYNLELATSNTEQK
jgi:hypothetical protein